MTASQRLIHELVGARLEAHRASHGASAEALRPPASRDPDELLTARQVARMFQKSVEVVRRSMRDGDLRGAFRPLGEWCIRRHDLPAALASRARPGRPVALPRAHGEGPEGRVPLRELARLCGEDIALLRAACETGLIPGAYRPQGDWRIRRAHVIAHIEAQITTRADLRVSDFEEAPSGTRQPQT